MPQPPPHRAVIGNRKFGYHADEYGVVNLRGPTSISTVNSTKPAITARVAKAFGQRCEFDGGQLDELDVCSLCGHDYSRC